MPTPVPELIAVEIETRLNTILVEDGYAFDVSEVVRPSRRGDNWLYKHNGVGLTQGESQRVPELDCPGNPPAIAYEVTYNLHCICKDSANLDAAHATNANKMAATVIKAITATANWHTMNDNAVDTQIGTHTPFDSPEGEIDGVTIPLLVTYRVSENNPYEVRA